MYKIETDSQPERIDLWLPSGMGEVWVGSLRPADTNYYVSYRIDKQ